MATVIICGLILAWAVFSVMTYKKKLTRGCCGASSGEKVRKVKAADQDISHYPHCRKLKIDGMVCGACAQRVENALNLLDGTWAKVDLVDGSALVYLKQESPDETLKEAVKNAGYTVYEIIREK